MFSTAFQQVAVKPLSKFTELLSELVMISERKEIRKQNRLEKLGTNNPVCVICGENDCRCLEAHHIAGKDYCDDLSIVCRNCHRKLSDDQYDHPKKLTKKPLRLEIIGHHLLGLSDLFYLISKSLNNFGHELINLAKGVNNA